MHPFMKNLLTPYGLVLILDQLPASVPAAKHQIKTCKSDLHDDEIDSLVTDEGKNSASEFVVQFEEHRGNEQVKDEVEEDCSDDDEHCSIGVGVGISHL